MTDEEPQAPVPEPPVSGTPTPNQPMAVDPRLLAILVCPVTKGELSYDRDAGELISRQAGLAFPVRDGIPIMLPDEARVLGN